MTDHIAKIINELELITSRGYDIHRVFSDWIDLMTLALRTPFTKEEHLEREADYLKIIHRYKNDLPTGQREADHFAAALNLLIKGMKQSNQELLGEIQEQLNLTYKGNGQFFTPAAICRLIAQIAFSDCDKVHPITGDPCAGSGRMLLEVARIKPEGCFVAQDIDLRCVKICALNFLFFNIDGLVIWGDSLAMEARLAYRTIRDIIWGGSLFLIEKNSTHWDLVERFVPGEIHQISAGGAF